MSSSENFNVCHNDVEAVAHKLTRTLTRGRSRVNKVNTLSVKDSATIRMWDEQGREDLTERSRMYSSHRSPEASDSVPSSNEDSKASIASYLQDPLSSTNAQFATALLKDGMGVECNVCDNMKERMALTTPITLELKRQSEKGLTDADIKEIRKGLLREAGCLNLLKQLDDKNKVIDSNSAKELNMSESAVAFFKTIYYADVPDILTSDDAQYADLRKVARATLSKVFVNASANEHFSVRDWFTSRGIQPRPVYTCSLISNSDLLLGQGPNGGHGGVGLNRDSTDKAKEKAQKEFRDNLTRMTSHVKELWMSGSDINQRIFHRVNRDEEVIGFLIGLKQMKVGAVIALGFPRSYNMTNVKTMVCNKGGYADMDLFSKPAFRSMERREECYKRNTARDFFNYFGAKDGDDGLPWREVREGVRKCQIQDFNLTSKLMKTIKNNLGWPMDLYELTVQWKEGCLCTSVDEELKLQVINIRTWDQSPSMLVKEQVSLLVDTVLGIDPENSFLFIHCAGGIGRTGNLAYGLSEFLCGDVPKDPLKKLEWFRSYRPGCVQTPEQLVDGMILSNMIMQDIIEKCEKQNQCQKEVQKELKGQRS